MKHFFGDYTTIYDTYKDEIELSIDLLTPIHSLNDWKKCGIVADFFGSYQALDYKFSSENVVSLISTIANELIENSVKFSFENSAISVKMQKIGPFISLETTNLASDKQIKKLMSFINKIKRKSFEQLFYDTIESTNHKSNKSELGLITIMKDYTSDCSIELKKVSTSNQNEVTIKFLIKESIFQS